MSELNTIPGIPAVNSSVRDLFVSRRAKAVLDGKYHRQFNAVLPALVCNDPSFINMLVKLAAELKADPSLDVDTSRLLSYSGWKATPAGHTNVDNRRYREEVMGLSSETFSRPEHREIFRHLTRLMFGRLVPSALRIPAKSSQGLPTLETDRMRKIESVKQALSGDWREIVKFCRTFDGESLLKYDIVCAYVQNYRVSPDKFGKERKVPDLDYALSGGQRGKLVSINYKDGVPDERMQACRPRRVMGMHNTLNSLLGVFFAAAEKYYLNEYSFTFKHQNYEGMTEKLRSFDYSHVLGVDVSAFDLSVPRWMFDEFFNVLKDIYNHEFVDFMKVLHFAPVFSPENGDGRGPWFIGDPMRISQLPSPGLLSGIRSVSSLGKLFNVFNLMCMAYDIGLCDNSAEGVESMLKGHKSLKMWNAGDDCLLFFSHESDCEVFKNSIDANLGYFKVDVELPIKFLGGKFDTSTPQHRFIPDLGSFLNNTFVPERPYTSKLRQHWPIGLRDRTMIYGSNPHFGDLMYVLNDVFQFYFPELGSFDAYSSKLLGDYQHLLTVSPLDSFDAQFLLNPDAIHYKLDADKISADLLALEFESIGVAEQEPFLNFILS